MILTLQSNPCFPSMIRPDKNKSTKSDTETSVVPLHAVFADLCIEHPGCVWLSSIAPATEKRTSLRSFFLFQSTIRKLCLATHLHRSDISYALPAPAYADCYNNFHALRKLCLMAPTRRSKEYKSLFFCKHKTNFVIPVLNRNPKFQFCHEMISYHSLN